MYVTFDRLDLSRQQTAPARASAPAAGPAGTGDWQPGSGYGTQRPRAATLAAILLLHAGLLTALIKLDVIPLHKAVAKPLVVTLMPEQIAPPPAPPPPPKQEIAPVMPAPVRIVAPAPVVVVPVAAPVQIATVTAPAPQATVATPAPAAAPAAVPAEVIPPNAFAGSLANPAPRYPVESRRRREQGTVRLRVVVTVDGRVKDIALAHSSGFDRLDEAAMDTVRKWRFRPGMQGGVPVEALGFLSIPFTLKA